MILGVAGAAVAAAVIGGSLLNSGRADLEQASQGDSNQGEKATASEMEQYREQVRIFDEEKQKLLNSLVFYQGTATTQETYHAVSGMEGDTPVVGSAAMVSEDIIVYDERTEKCYLVARRISLLGDSVKAFDIPGIYKGDVTVKVCGILTEYYGNGILQAYDAADALQGKKGYYLSFSANPIRIECATELIITDPPVKNTYWVQVIGPDSFDMIANGVFAPTELPYVEVGLMPGLSHLFGEKTYNSNQTLIYEYTGGKIVPQGTFSFDYKKMSYGEIKDFLDELKTESQKDKQLEDAAETLSDAWKDALSVQQEMRAVIDATEGIQSYSQHFSGESSADTADAKIEADILVNGADFNGELIQVQDALDTMESAGGSLRKLEDFSLDGGEGDRRQAADAMGSLLPVLKEYLTEYRAATANLQNYTADLRKALQDEATIDADAQLILEKIRNGSDELSRFGTCLSQLSSHFYTVLLSYDQGVGDDETEYAALSRLFGLWETTLRDFLSGVSPAVDAENVRTIPSDYPSGVVPLPKDAVPVTYETDTDGTIMLMIKTNMASAEAVEYYKNALSGVPDLSSFSMGGIQTITGTKGDYELNILVSANQLGGNEPTMIQIMLTPT